MIVDDEFLGETLGVVGHAAIISDDQLDLLAGDHVAVLRHVELDRGDHFLPGGADRPGHRHDEADLDGVLGGGGAGCRRHNCDRKSGGEMRAAQGFLQKQHGVSPIEFVHCEY